MTEPEFETVIGLEVHVQLQLASKLFAPTEYAAGGEPNTRVSVIELGLPGVLPALNERAVELAIRAGLALESTIGARVHFDRKNYFYPDLPKGYQITQLDRPLCVGGRVPLGEGEFGALQRIHLEEDAGKSSHHAAGSLVDLNRAGAALIEIVGQPDLRSPEQAFRFLTRLKQILQYAEVSECDMEKGSLRCDANISLRPVGSETLGTKVELKNLNSPRMVERALEYEVRRQTAILATGGKVTAETRGWHDELGESRSQRSKENAPDYRYLPDPDLPVLELDAAFVAARRAEIGELPTARRDRYRAAHGLGADDAEALTRDRTVGDWFEQVVAAGADAKAACNWLVEDLLPRLRERGLGLAVSPIAPGRLATLIGLVQQKSLTQPAARQVLDHLLDHDVTPEQAVRELGLGRIADEVTLRPLCEAAIAELPAAAADVAAGKDKAIDALKGRVMRATKGRADPQVLDAVLRAVIGGPQSA
ncbi:MAG: Asp-tRNA(Asn)/Glu-tRNA(Gln) amidotransferase subunit GatB [Planctomycetes bacterium]|nr:Asp-tRNA(Asn)/Glu-tRNA(Gln) amidotransferase subunit GatB [Planctomycetota bacterium]